MHRQQNQEKQWLLEFIYSAYKGRIAVDGEEIARKVCKEEEERVREHNMQHAKAGSFKMAFDGSPEKKKTAIKRAVIAARRRYKREMQNFRPNARKWWRSIRRVNK